MATNLAVDIFKCINLNENDRILIQISLKCILRRQIDNKPALVLVMAWRRTGDKPLHDPMMSQCIDTCGTQGRRVNTLRPRQNGCHFVADILNCIFLNENVWISIKISLNFVSKGPINNIPALVQIMAWCHPGNMPLSEPMMVSLPTHICVTRPQWFKGLAHKRQQSLPGPMMIQSFDASIHKQASMG